MQSHGCRDLARIGHLRDARSRTGIITMVPLHRRHQRIRTHNHLGINFRVLSNACACCSPRSRSGAFGGLESPPPHGGVGPPLYRTYARAAAYYVTDGLRRVPGVPGLEPDDAACMACAHGHCLSSAGSGGNGAAESCFWCTAAALFAADILGVSAEQRLAHPGPLSCAASPSMMLLLCGSCEPVRLTVSHSAPVPCCACARPLRRPVVSLVSVRTGPNTRGGLWRRWQGARDFLRLFSDSAAAGTSTLAPMICCSGSFG